jgi:hypothetical protein
VQGRESLGCHPTSQHQAKTGYQHGQRQRDTKATSTPTHGHILGMVQVNHNGDISARVHFQWVSRLWPTFSHCEISTRKPQIILPTGAES